MDGLLGRLEADLRDLGVLAMVRSRVPAGGGVQATTADLTRGTSTQGYTLIHGPVVRLADAPQLGAADRPTLVFTTFVSPKTAETFRRAEVQYLDTAGNAWIRFGDVLIDVRGRPRPHHTPSRTQVAGNLFSTGRAQVVFALLAWPQLWDAPQREVAHASGVSLGQAHNTLMLLAEAGYRGDRARPEQTELLDLWAATFPTGLATKLRLSTYRGDIETVRKVNPDDPVFVSGESATGDLLRPATLTIYVDKLDPHLAIVNRWRADGEPNVAIRRTFWHAPDNSDAPIAGLRNAPAPLVYADLLGSSDPRVRGTAKDWRNRLAGLDHHA